tara:strand:+ start:22 stop:1275 length:1254 start_codon:yes stop_codon:yes gene_type:complete
MSYLGIQPSTVFQAGSKDSFDGDGSTTAFTLSKAVTLATDIEVFVGNVRQEPDVAYTVSGVTLTFTGTPASGTGNIYAVHQATSHGTLVPPTGRAENLSTLVTSGTITSGGTVAVTGNVTATGTVEPAGDTAAGDNAAIGFTSTEGLILTGQGSTNDVTIKNDADADVIEIPTGTTNVTVAGTLGTGGLITSGAGITGAGLLTTGGNIVIPDAGNIGSASDTDAIAIASDGVVTFSQAPVFSAGGAAGLALLQTVTASNDATVLVGSSSLFTSTHKVYILHVINAHPVTDSVEFRCRLSKGGSIISADYEYSRNQTIHSSSFTNRGSNSDDHVNLAESLGNANDESHNMVITMYNPAETTFKKLVNFSSAGMDLSPNMARNHGVFGHEGDSAAIDGIQFFYSSGNVSTGTFKLYGVV